MAECSICTVEFKENDNVLTHDSEETGMTVAHLFHEACLMRWYEENQNCPQCRNEIEWGDWIPVVI